MYHKSTLRVYFSDKHREGRGGRHVRVTVNAPVYALSFEQPSWSGTESASEPAAAPRATVTPLTAVAAAVSTAPSFSAPISATAPSSSTAASEPTNASYSVSAARPSGNDAARSVRRQKLRS